jgi:LPS export ABC transporter protein LptC
LNKLFYLLILLFLANCKSNDIEKVKLFTDSNKPLPVETSRNVELLFSDSALLKIKLIASKLERFETENPYTEFNEGVEVYFFDENGKSESQITAKLAKQYENEEKMEAWDSVVVINVKGEKLNTEHLWWEKKTAMIYSDVFVKITTADEVIFGEGLEANEDFTKYKIKKIKGTFSHKE